MHDSLAHRLAVLSTLAGALEYNPQAPPEDLARAADAIRSSAHASLDDLRSVIGVLRDDPEPGHDGDSTDALERPQPTLRHLPGLVEEWRRARPSVVLRPPLDDMAPGPVPAPPGHSVYHLQRASRRQQAFPNRYLPHSPF